MNKTGKIWMNGKLVSFQNAKVHVHTHALHYSTSIFEGIRCYDTPTGSAIFRLSDHVDRLFISAKLYSMKMQYTKKQVMNAIIQTVRANKLKECYIRPLAYRGFGRMGVTPSGNKVDLAISCWRWNLGESKAGKFSGSKCKISSWLKIDSRAQPMRAKATSNYGNAALARVEALDEGYDEAILLNYHGNITEGPAENIFIVKNNQIYTPPLSAGILNGITRDCIIQIVAQNGGDYGNPVIETNLQRDDLYDADEIFMTGTAAEIKSVTQIDKIQIGRGRVGKITKTLQDQFMKKVVMGKDPQTLSWLTYI